MVMCMLVSCMGCGQDKDKPVDKAGLTGSDYRLFQGTPAWDLARAVRDEDEKQIDALVAKDPALINYQEPKFGGTLLMLTIKNQQMTSFRKLLADKADISIHNTYDGTSALIFACSNRDYSSRYAEALVELGANVNDVETGPRRKGNSTRYTPLMAASEEGRTDLVLLLIGRGANVNYQNEFKQTALSEAVLVRKFNTALLLLQNGADYTKPLFFSPDENRDMYLVDVMRGELVDLGTNEYQDKMKVVAFLKEKGIDYRAAPIPELVRKRAQQSHPNDWKEYLEKY